MTLLSIIQNACNEMGVPAPLTVETTTDKRAVTLNALARREQIELARRNDWPSLIIEYTFNTVVGQVDYGMPSAIDKVLRDTAYDAAEYYKVRGGLTPAEWRYAQNNNSLIIGPAFRISSTGAAFGSEREFRIVPAPTLVEAYVFEYKTKNTAYGLFDDGVSITHVAKPVMTLDLDTTRLDESLIELGVKWRWLKSRGLDYGEEYRTYNEAVDLRYAQDLTLPTVPLAPRRDFLDLSPMTNGYVPDRGYGA